MKLGKVLLEKLNRPKEFNAVTYELFDDLIKALEICHDDKDIKAADKIINSCDHGNSLYPETCDRNDKWCNGRSRHFHSSCM